VAPSENLGGVTLGLFRPSAIGSITATGVSVPAVPPCRVDFDGDGTVTPVDIFAFVNGWFLGDPHADYDGVGGITQEDVFAYIAAWFAGC